MPELPDEKTRPLTQVILKVASRCNLDCTYCYVYNRGDSTWKARPTFMSDRVFEATLERIRSHVTESGQSSINIVFHGGEPCLAGPERIDGWCERIRDRLSGIQVHLAMQSNGTLIDDAWCEVLARHDVGVGVSLDGPREVHDAQRVDHRGDGSYDRTVRGLTALREANVRHGVSVVIPFGADPIATHSVFEELEVPSVTYLFPDYTHDSIGELRLPPGATPCADFLIAVFDRWWAGGTLDLEIRDFVNMSRVIMGGESLIETIGNRPPRYAFVETGGDIEGLDNLRVCGDGFANTGLTVIRDEFKELERVAPLHHRIMFDGIDVPEDCRSCPEVDTCAGGHVPHRYSRARGFDNRSVWCADLLKIFTHIRARLDVTYEETHARRDALARLRVCASRPDERSMSV